MTYVPAMIRPSLPLPAVRRAIEQSRDLAGYMVWPAGLEDQINRAAAQVTGLCWASTEVPTGDRRKRLSMSCLLPMNHDGDCGWKRPLAMRVGAAVAS